MFKRISLSAWRMAYSLEEARQTHAALGQLWRQAACCIGLTLFRMIGGRA